MDTSNVTLSGRLARDPVFFGEDTKRRALFTVATTRRGKGDDKIVTFVNCICWGGFSTQLDGAVKGDSVTVVGILDSEKNKDEKYFQLRVQALHVAVVPRQTRKTEAPVEDTADLPF